MTTASGSPFCSGGRNWRADRLPAPLEQFDIVHRRRHHDAASCDRGFFARHIGPGIAVEPADEGTPGMGLEQDTTGIAAAEILTGGLVALIGKKLPDELDILGTHVIECRIDLAPAKDLDLEVCLLAGAATQHL